MKEASHSYIGRQLLYHWTPREAYTHTRTHTHTHIHIHTHTCVYAYCSEKALETHSSSLAWKIPWTEEPGRLQSTESLRVGHGWAASLILFPFMNWRRKWQPLKCSYLGNPRDGGAWWAAVYGVTQSRTRLKRLSSSSSRMHIVDVVESLSRVQLFMTPWTAVHQASLSITISLSFLKLVSTESVMPSNYLILCCPLLLLHSIFPIIRVFSNEFIYVYMYILYIYIYNLFLIMSEF